jgi:hypothetical protein
MGWFVKVTKLWFQTASLQLKRSHRIVADPVAQHPNKVLFSRSNFFFENG